MLSAAVALVLQLPPISIALAIVGFVAIAFGILGWQASKRPDRASPLPPVPIPHERPDPVRSSGYGRIGRPPLIEKMPDEYRSAKMREFCGQKRPLVETGRETRDMLWALPSTALRADQERMDRAIKVWWRQLIALRDTWGALPDGTVGAGPKLDRGDVPSPAPSWRGKYLWSVQTGLAWLDRYGDCERP